MDGNANGGCIADPYFHRIRMDDEYEIDRSGLMGIIGNENGYEGVKSNEWESINE